LLSPIYLFKVHSGGLEKQPAEAGNSASQEVCRRERRHRHRHHQPHPHSSSPYSPWKPRRPSPTPFVFATMSRTILVEWSEKLQTTQT